MIFDLQRFNDEQTADDAQVETSADDAQSESPQEELPEELGGLPEEYAREVLDEWKQSNPEAEQQTESRPSLVNNIKRQSTSLTSSKRNTLHSIKLCNSNNPRRNSNKFSNRRNSNSNRRSSKSRRKFLSRLTRRLTRRQWLFPA